MTYWNLENMRQKRERERERERERPSLCQLGHPSQKKKLNFNSSKMKPPEKLGFKL